VWDAAHAVDFVGEQLGITFADGLREDLIDGYRIVGETADLDPAPGVEACLRDLRDAGMRLGIVCDVGLTAAPTLRDRLQGFGLLGYFDAWAFSDETGWYKPAEGAFRPALEGLGAAPEEAAHVGDNARTDIAGARALGMVAVQYTGLSGGHASGEDHAVSPEADHVVDDLATLPAVLGVGSA
jgi:putative hydrolase of the HAD superfamily